jgi:hypothetical protein
MESTKVGNTVAQIIIIKIKNGLLFFSNPSFLNDLVYPTTVTLTAFIPFLPF